MPNLPLAHEESKPTEKFAHSALDTTLSEAGCLLSDDLRGLCLRQAGIVVLVFLKGLRG